jgi:hypothetical protein
MTSPAAPKITASAMRAIPAEQRDREFADSPLEEGGFELVVPLCLGIDIVIGDSSLVPREFGLARQAYGAIA